MTLRRDGRAANLNHTNSHNCRLGLRAMKANALPRGDEQRCVQLPHARTNNVLDLSPQDIY